MMDQSLMELLVDEYEGEREGDANVFHGRGKCVYKNGSIYEGEFDSGLMHGEGRFVWVNGLVYLGTFIDNTISGRGKYLFPDGSVYEGEVENGLRHGVGKFEFPDGPVYDGDWVKSCRMGKGKLTYEEGCYYEGDWKDNLRHGFGKMVYKSGCVYEGEWIHNERSGKGTCTWADQNYNGDWKQGIEDGNARITWFVPRMKGSQFHKHNQFLGRIKQGKKHGGGTLLTASGSCLKGQWMEDKKNSSFTIEFENGHVEEEIIFENDMMVKGSLSPQCFQLYIPKFEDETELAKNQLVNIILQNISLLRRVYDFYAALHPVEEKKQWNVFQLQIFQFQQLLLDIDILRLGITLCDVNNVLTGIDLKTKNEMGCTSCVYNPSSYMSLCSFFSALTSIARAAFQHEYADSEFGVALCVDKFFKKVLFPNACMLSGYPLSKPLHLDLFYRHRDEAIDTCNHLSKGKGQGIVIQHILHACERNSMLNTFFTFPLIKSMLCQVAPHLRGDFNVYYKMVFLEVFGFIVHAAVSATLHMEEEQKAFEKKYIQDLKQKRQEERERRKREAAELAAQILEEEEKLREAQKEAEEHAKHGGKKKHSAKKGGKKGSAKRAQKEDSSHAKQNSSSNGDDTNGEQARVDDDVDHEGDEEKSEPDDVEETKVKLEQEEEDNFDESKIKIPRTAIGWMASDLDKSFVNFCRTLTGQRKWLHEGNEQ
eukprot:m.37491 g.37491  ORF g.37491 m.37491 type:complete len:708 (-) comp6738_c0_seq1:29-2152(-)